MIIKLTENNIKALKSAFKVLKQNGFYAKTQLKAYLDSGEIPDRVLRVIKEVLKMETNFDTGMPVNATTVLTDENVMQIATAIYVEQVSAAKAEDHNNVISIGKDDFPIIMKTHRYLKDYLKMLEEREKAVIQDIAKISTEATPSAEQIAHKNNLLREVKTLKKSMEIAFKAKTTLNTMTSTTVSDAMVGTVEFLKSGEMDELNALFKILFNKASTDKIEHKDVLVEIENKLKKFNKASDARVKKKTKSDDPSGDDGDIIIVDPGPDDPRIVDIDGGADPVIRDPGPIDDTTDDGDTPPTGDGDDTPPADDGDDTPPTDDGDTPPTGDGDDTPPVDDGDDIPPTDDGDTPPTDDGDESGDTPVHPIDETPVAPYTPVEPIDVPKPADDVDDSVPVPGAINTAKTRKIGAGRRFINWLGRHWLLASVVVTAATLAIGALAGPLAPAAISVAHFGLFNVGTFATIGGVALAVKHFTFMKRRGANSAQAHFFGRERKVQRTIKKSEKLLTQISAYQTKIDNLTVSLDKCKTARERKKVLNQIKKCHDRMRELDIKNIELIEKLNNEFTEAKLPAKFNIPGKIWHRLKVVTGNETLSNLQAEFGRFIDKRAAKISDPVKREKAEEMKLDGNLIDEYMNYQFLKRKTQEELRRRAEQIKKTDKKGVKSLNYKQVQAYLERLHKLGYDSKILTGPVGSVTKDVGLTVKNIVEATPDVDVTMDVVDGKEITTYVDETSGKKAIVVTTPKGEVRTYGDADVAKKAITPKMGRKS